MENVHIALVYVDFIFTDVPTMEQVNGPPYPNSHCSNFNSSQIQLVLQVSSGAKGVELAVFTAVTLGDDVMSVISLMRCDISLSYCRMVGVMGNNVCGRGFGNDHNSLGGPGAGFYCPNGNGVGAYGGGGVGAVMVI